MLSRSSRHQAAGDDSRPADESSAVAPYSEMQKSMMDEMDKRRHDWENEMHRMQEDFFKVGRSLGVLSMRGRVYETVRYPSVCLSVTAYRDVKKIREKFFENVKNDKNVEQFKKTFFKRDKTSVASRCSIARNA